MRPKMRQKIQWGGGLTDVVLIFDRLYGGQCMEAFSAYMLSGDLPYGEVVNCGSFSAQKFYESRSGLSGNISLTYSSRYHVMVVTGWVRGSHQRAQRVGDNFLYAVIPSQGCDWSGLLVISDGERVARVSPMNMFCADILSAPTRSELFPTTLYAGDGSPVELDLPGCRGLWRFTRHFHPEHTGIFPLFAPGEGAFQLGAGEVFQVEGEFFLVLHSSGLASSCWISLEGAINAIPGAELISPEVAVWERQKGNGDVEGYTLNLATREIRYYSSWKSDEDLIALALREPEAEPALEEPAEEPVSEEPASEEEEWLAE